MGLAGAARCGWARGALDVALWSDDITAMVLVSLFQRRWSHWGAACPVLQASGESGHKDGIVLGLIKSAAE